MRHPSIFEIDNLLRHVDKCRTQIIVSPSKPDIWVPSRPIGYPGFAQRLKAAWLVFTGKADALKWRGQ